MSEVATLSSTFRQQVWNDLIPSIGFFNKWLICRLSVTRWMMTHLKTSSIDIITNWRFTVRFCCVSGWHGRPVGVMVSCLRFLINSKNYTDKINNLIITREAGWRYTIMSTVPHEQQKLYRQIILLLHGKLVWRPVNRQLVIMSMLYPILVCIIRLGWHVRPLLSHRTHFLSHVLPRYLALFFLFLSPYSSALSAPQATIQPSRYCRSRDFFGWSLFFLS